MVVYYVAQLRNIMKFSILVESLYCSSTNLAS